MASVQDHTPVVKELGDRRQPDPQPGQPLPTQQAPPKTDSPRPLTSELLQESSPPRFSQVLDPLPGTSESNPRGRGPSTATNPATLVNHPGTVGNNGTGPVANIPVGLGGEQNASVVQDRNQIQSASLAPGRRQTTLLYDPIRGDTPVQVHVPDDEEPDRRHSTRWASLPRPRPIFSHGRDRSVSGNGNGSRGVPRGGSDPDLPSDPRELEEPRARTIKARLLPTLVAAREERDKYKKRAGQQSLLINGAIGLQVIVGAITTGVAAASTNIGSAVAVLGGISTALASYLAKVRGSGEPEFSNTRARELSTFIREVDAFLLDQGHKETSEFDDQIAAYRARFELIIKTEGENSTSGTGYAPHPGPNYHANSQPMGQQGMPGGYGGRGFQSGPQGPQAGGQLSEKQWKNEKALGGMV